MILDEATSHLDNDNEAHVQAALEDGAARVARRSSSPTVCRRSATPTASPCSTAGASSSSARTTSSSPVTASTPPSCAPAACSTIRRRRRAPHDRRRISVACPQLLGRCDDVGVGIRPMSRWPPIGELSARVDGILGVGGGIAGRSWYRLRRPWPRRRCRSPCRQVAGLVLGRVAHVAGLVGDIAGDVLGLVGGITGNVLGLVDGITGDVGGLVSVVTDLVLDGLERIPGLVLEIAGDLLDLVEEARTLVLVSWRAG